MACFFPKLTKIINSQIKNVNKHKQDKHVHTHTQYKACLSQIAKNQWKREILREAREEYILYTKEEELEIVTDFSSEMHKPKAMK